MKGRGRKGCGVTFLRGSAMFLWLVSWLGVVAEISFAVFSLAAGLYYLAELVEEYSVLAKRFITSMIIFVIVVYAGLFIIDGFPLLMIVMGILTQLCFASLLYTFPVISLLSPGFIGGCLLLIVEHYQAFQYFATYWHPFQEVLAFFFLCLWMVPFAFFISLSANDLVLPTLETSSDGERRSRRSGFLLLVDFMASKIGSVTPSRSSKSS